MASPSPASTDFTGVAKTNAEKAAIYTRHAAALFNAGYQTWINAVTATANDTARFAQRLAAARSPAEIVEIQRHFLEASAARTNADLRTLYQQFSDTLSALLKGLVVGTAEPTAPAVPESTPVPETTPAAAEPAIAEPVAAEPVAAEPVAAEPVAAEPAPTTVPVADLPAEPAAETPTPVETAPEPPASPETAAPAPKPEPKTARSGTRTRGGRAAKTKAGSAEPEAAAGDDDDTKHNGPNHSAPTPGVSAPNV